MLEVRLMLLLFLLFLIISALPIVQLRYASDLYESIEKMSDICYQNFKCSNDNIVLPEKYKYLYNIANTLYDIDDLSNDNDDSNENDDEKKRMQKYQKFYKTLFIIAFSIIIIVLVFNGVIYSYIYRANTYSMVYSLFISIVIILILALSIFYFQTKNTSLNEMNMLFYKRYLNHSMPTFFLGIWIFLFIYIYLFIQYYNNEYISISLMVLIFIFTTLFTIIFGLVLKKITEIYNDTILQKYINLMRKINQFIKPHTIYTITVHKNDKIYVIGQENEATKLMKIAEKIKTYTNDKNRYFKEIAFSKKTLYNLIDTYKTDKNVLKNTRIDYKNITEDDYKSMTITEDDILDYEKFHSKKSIDNIKYKINVVTSYLYAYAFFLLVLVFLFMRTINDNSIYVMIIGIYLAIVILYYVYVSLRA